MEKNIVIYRGYVKNDNGAGEFAGSDSSINNLKQTIRSRYGKGWTVTIEKVEAEDENSCFPPVEVCQFKLRK